MIGTSSPSHAFNTSFNSGLSHIRLPPITLPDFNGQTCDWPQFIEVFDSIIHTDVNMKETQKLQYLITCLRGEAKAVVSSLSIAPGQYAAARKLLKDRYENKRLIVSTLLHRITSLNTVRADNNADLRAFKTTYSSVIESLKKMKIKFESWDPLLIHMLVQYFDKPLRKD